MSNVKNIIFLIFIYKSHVVKYILFSNLKFYFVFAYRVIMNTIKILLRKERIFFSNSNKKQKSMDAPFISNESYRWRSLNTPSSSDVWDYDHKRHTKDYCMNITTHSCRYIRVVITTDYFTDDTFIYPT